MQNQIFILFLLLISGYTAKKFRVISNEMNRDLSSFILNVALPGMIITSMNFSFSMELLIKSGKLLVISWVVYGVSIGISYVVPRLLSVDGTRRDIFQFLTVFSNVGFMGYPVVNAVFGEKGVFYAALYNLPFNILLFSFGIMILSRPSRYDGNENSVAFNWKELLNPGIIAVMIGFILFLTSSSLPGPIYTTLKMLGDTTTPLSMVFVGSILADVSFKTIFTDIKVFLASGVRLLVMPILTLIGLKLLFTDPMIIGIPVIITAMPVAANAAILSTKYGNDYQLASQVIFISTMLSMATIPFIVTLL
ncbi:MAG: AEC family transporter [Bacillota bacterium]